MTTKYAVGLDLLWVLVFALVGRASHAESLDLAGIALTAWPFIVALVAGWVTILMLKRTGLLLVEGVALWALTVVAGLWIRVNGGATAEPAFITVASIFLASGLLGWRLVNWLLTRPWDRRG